MKKTKKAPPAAAPTTEEGVVAAATAPPPPDLEHYESEIVEVASLKPHPRNYRTHPEDQLAHIMESIKEHGIYRNVVVAKDGTILAGHGVVEASKKLGMLEIPVVRLPLGPNDSRALKLLAGDNEISRIAGVDDRALTELLKEIKIEDPDGLLGTGYDDRQLAALAMVTRPSSEIADFDAAAEWLGMPTFDPGEASVELHVSFPSPEKRDEFMKTMLAMDPDAGGVRRAREKSVRDIWSMWWPPQRDKRYDTEIVQGDPLAGVAESQLAKEVEGTVGLANDLASAGATEEIAEAEAAISEAKAS